MTESQLIEYKESWRDEYLKWICVFANVQGGRNPLYDTCDDLDKESFDNFHREAIRSGHQRT